MTALDENRPLYTPRPTTPAEVARYTGRGLDRPAVGGQLAPRIVALPAQVQTRPCDRRQGRSEFPFPLCVAGITEAGLVGVGIRADAVGLALVPAVGVAGFLVLVAVLAVLSWRANHSNGGRG